MESIHLPLRVSYVGEPIQFHSKQQHLFQFESRQYTSQIQLLLIHHPQGIEIHTPQSEIELTKQTRNQ
jgi:hypothetical protein